MDKDRIKFLIQNIEVLLEALKEEVFQNASKPTPDYKEVASYLDEYEPDYYEEH